MTAVRRSEGPRPGGTDGERASRKTTKYSPVGREGIGTSTIVRGQGEGGDQKPSLGQSNIVLNLKARV